jgi:hypothetical protein
VGAVDDARPDRWGEKVIRYIDKPKRHSLMEYLYYAGDDRFGALGVSTSATDYTPRAGSPLPRLEQAQALSDAVARIEASEPLNALQAKLVRSAAAWPAPSRRHSSRSQASSGNALSVSGMPIRAGELRQSDTLRRPCHYIGCRARAFGPGAAGAEIAEQFGKMGDNLPLDALCRKIDIDPRKSLGQPRFLLGGSRQTAV